MAGGGGRCRVSCRAHLACSTPESCGPLKPNKCISCVCVLPFGRGSEARGALRVATHDKDTKAIAKLTVELELFDSCWRLSPNNRDSQTWIQFEADIRAVVKKQDHRATSRVHRPVLEVHTPALPETEVRRGGPGLSALAAGRRQPLQARLSDVQHGGRLGRLR
jgi:hypothetical protein